MNRSTTAVLVAVIAILALGGVLVFGNREKKSTNTSTTQSTNTESETTPNESSTSQEPTDETDEMVTVNIENFAFAPSTVTVKKGGSVTWTNRDSVQHDITPDTEGDAFQKSELLAKDESYTWKFETVGTYTYHCSPHPNMTGTITVVE